MQDSERLIDGWVQMTGPYDADDIIEFYMDKINKRVNDDTLILVSDSDCLMELWQAWRSELHHPRVKGHVKQELLFVSDGLAIFAGHLQGRTYFLVSKHVLLPYRSHSFGAPRGHS
jgi:hypothetical protein